MKTARTIAGHVAVIWAAHAIIVHATRVAMVDEMIFSVGHEVMKAGGFI